METDDHESSRKALIPINGGEREKNQVGVARKEPVPQKKKKKQKRPPGKRGTPSQEKGPKTGGIPKEKKIKAEPGNPKKGGGEKRRILP